MDLVPQRRQVATTPDTNGAKTTPGSWRIGAQFNGGNITLNIYGSLARVTWRSSADGDRGKAMDRTLELSSGL